MLTMDDSASSLSRPPLIHAQHDPLQVVPGAIDDDSEFEDAVPLESDSGGEFLDDDEDDLYDSESEDDEDDEDEEDQGTLFGSNLSLGALEIVSDNATSHTNPSTTNATTTAKPSRRKATRKKPQRTSKKPDNNLTSNRKTDNGAKNKKKAFRRQKSFVPKDEGK